MVIMNRYTIDKPTLQREFFSEEWTTQRNWFVENFKGQKTKIVELFYKFLENVQCHVCFFDWFNVYLLANNIEPSWNITVSQDSEINTITVWHRKNGEYVKSSLPPSSSFYIPGLGDKYLASPFKYKSDDTVGAQDIKALMEQNNYTNQYLQTIGEKLSEVKTIPETKTKDSSEPDPLVQTQVKPLFKPSNLTEQTRQKLRLVHLDWKKSIGESISSRAESRLPPVIEDTPPGSSTRTITRSISQKEKEQNLRINKLGTSSVGSDAESQPNSDSKSVLSLNPVINKAANWKQPSKLYYNRATAPDLLLEEKNGQSFRSFSANNIYEWNIDGQSEYNILNTLQHMAMVSTAYQASLDSSDQTIVEILTSGFSGQLKGWWDSYLSDEQRDQILNAVKTDADGNIITNRGEPVPDAVNTLIMSIVQHFIGDPNIWRDRSGDLLSKLRCKTLGGFRYYKDTFLTRVFTRDDCQQPFWKETFLAGLPKSLGDKVREKIRTQFNGEIPYNQLSYGQLIAYIQKVGLKICQDEKIQNQLAREKAQNRKDLGSFCQQFGLPCSDKPSGSRTKSRKTQRFHESRTQDNHPVKPYRSGQQSRTRTKRSSNRQTQSRSARPSKSKSTHISNQSFDKSKETRTCFKCGRQGHLAKQCRIVSSIEELNLEKSKTEELLQLCYNLSEEDCDESSEEIQADDDLSSSSDESSDSPTINVLHNDEQNLLIDAIKSIQDPHEREEYLDKLKMILRKPDPSQPKSSNRFFNNRFDLTQTLKRLEKSTAKPVTIQDLQTEIHLLKDEVRNLKHQQQLHQNVITQITEILSDHPNDDDHIKTPSSNPSSDSEQDNLFAALINRCTIQKFYIPIHIQIGSFSLQTVALFDTGADSNCILEGLVPTKYFHKSSEKLRTANGSSLKIQYKLPSAIIKNDGLQIETPFLLVKNLSNEVILGTPFIKTIFPITITNQGISTQYLGKTILFKFLNNPIHRSLNPIEAKQKQINFLKDDLSFETIKSQLATSSVQTKISNLHTRIQNTVCSELPNAFWERKKHMVDLPYEKDFNDRLIPTKARPIQMSLELVKHCQSEINDLLAKGLIQKSKSPWSCAAFYVNKASEIERGSPRLVINYKPLNQALQWIRYPNQLPQLPIKPPWIAQTKPLSKS